MDRYLFIIPVLEWQPGTVTTGGIQVGGGVTTLLGLNDVPGTYVGEGNPP